MAKPKRVKIEKNIYKIEGSSDLLVRVTVRDPRRRTPLDTERISAGDSIKAARILRDQLREELNRIARGDVDQGLNILFRDFCATRIERRQATGDIGSNSTLKKLKGQLKHVLPMWGDFYLDKISRDAVERWHAGLCRIARGEQHQGRRFSPHTVRGWWTAFRAVMTYWAQTFGKIDPANGIDCISLDGHVTYSLEEPNSLAVIGEVAAFMAATRRIAPDHEARFALGILTSRRPCELRPLRRKGPNADINWQTGVIQIRRSQTLGEPMQGTKTKETFSIGLPPALLAVLKAHADKLDRDGDQTELLFPGARGAAYESDQVLTKVLPEICKAAGIGKELTAYFMRRTFHDLMRRAGISDLLVKSMGGHSIAPIPGVTNRKTLAMVYSTIRPSEQAEAIEAMAKLCGMFEATDPSGSAGVAAQPEDAAFVADLREAA